MRMLFALAIGVVGAAFALGPGAARAAPTAPGAAISVDGAAKQAGSHDANRGGGHHKNSAFRRGGILGHLGRYQSLLGMLAGGQGGGIASMLGGMGGAGNTGGFASMLGGMGGDGNAGGFASMLGGMGGDGNAGGFASMLGGMGGAGNAGGFTSMLGGAGGSGAQSPASGQVSQSARQACTPDALRLCSDYIPDVGKITACMRAKSAQLSTPCRAAMNAEGARLAGRSTAGPARSEDVATYGGDDSATHGGGGQNSYEAAPGYDRYGSVQNLGGGGFDIGRMMGMARSFGMRW